MNGASKQHIHHKRRSCLNNTLEGPNCLLMAEGKAHQPASPLLYTTSTSLNPPAAELAANTHRKPYNDLVLSVQATQHTLHRNESTMAAISVFEPHHEIHVDYPCLELLDPESEELALASIENSSERYEPRNLIDDTAVMSHASRDNEAETEFHSLVKARLGTAQELESMRRSIHEYDEDEDNNGINRLGMDLITQYDGATMLEVVTYQTANLETGTTQPSNDGVDMVRIRRTAHFKPDVKTAIRDTATYTTSLEDFGRIDCSGRQWMTDINDLLSGHSDRAVQHVAVRSKAQLIPDSPVVWRPERRMKFEQVIGKISKTLDVGSLQEDDQSCVSCMSQYGDPDCEPLVLLCSALHMICRRCLLEWCHAHGPDSVTCPHCRYRLIRDEADIEWLKFGVWEKAYIYDHRYDQWENFERSCADLDKEHAENNTRDVTVSYPLLLRVWTSLVDGALLESARSTPLHLQPARTLEFITLKATLQSSFDTLHGVTLPTNALYALLLHDIYQAFARAFLRAGLQAELTNEALSKLLDAPTASQLGLQDGFHEFVRRTLSRMLQFCHVRVCRCDSQEYHRHGLREYYNAPEKPAGHARVIELRKSYV